MSLVQIGPYSAHEAECIAEQALDTTELRDAMESTLRGDSNSAEFLMSFMFIVESLHSDFFERQRELEPIQEER